MTTDLTPSAMTDVELNILLLKTLFVPNAQPYCLGESKRDLETTYMWYWIPSGKPRRTHEIDSRPIPDFLRDWNHTMQVVEKLRPDGWTMSLWVNEFKTEPWDCRFFLGEDRRAIAHASTGQRAICLAALQAVSPQ